MSKEKISALELEILESDLYGKTKVITVDDYIVSDHSFGRLITNKYYQESVSDILGKVLTVIDSSIPAGQQNKAIKDLIKDKFYFQTGETTSWCWGRENKGV